MISRKIFIVMSYVGVHTWNPCAYAHCRTPIIRPHIIAVFPHAYYTLIIVVLLQKGYLIFVEWIAKLAFDGKFYCYWTTITCGWAGIKDGG